MRGSMKQSILRAVSRSAARLLLIHVFVLNEGREPFNEIITGSTNGLAAGRILFASLRDDQ